MLATVRGDLPVLGLSVVDGGVTELVLVFFLLSA